MASCLEIPVNAYLHSNIDIRQFDDGIKFYENIILIDENLNEHPSEKMINDSDCTLIVWDGIESNTLEIMKRLKKYGKQGKIMNVGVIE